MSDTLYKLKIQENQTNKLHILAKVRGATCDLADNNNINNNINNNNNNAEEMQQMVDTFVEIYELLNIDINAPKLNC